MNAPVLGVVAPIAVELISTPLMLTVVNTAAVVMPSPAELTIKMSPANPTPDKVGNLSKACVTSVNSLRMATDAPGAFGAGTVPPL